MINPLIPRVLAFYCLFAIGFSLDAVANKSQQAELEQLKSSISTLEKKLQTQHREKDSLQHQLKLIELQSIEVNRRLRVLRAKIANAEKQLLSLTEKQQQLQQRISDQRSAIAEQIRSTHKIGSEEPIKLLLNQQDPQQIARIFKYYGYLLEARSTKIQQFKTDIEALDALVANINNTKIALAKSKKDLQTDRKLLANNVADRKKMLHRVQSRLLTDKEKLAALQKQRNALEELINAVKVMAAKIAPATDYPSFASSKGKLIWPVKGSLTHRFGSQRSEYLRWEGWLISARSGTAVQSIHHGRVVFSNYLRGFGLLVIVDHGDSFMSLYAHNQELLRETGDWVQSGETVSRAGNTGGLNKSALYFEIRNQGVPIDPQFWLRKR